MAKRNREVGGLNIALLDILTGALGAVIILFVAVPKGTQGDLKAPKAPVSIVEEDVSQLHAEISSKEKEIKKLQKIVLETQGENRQLLQKGEESIQKIEALRKFASEVGAQKQQKAGKEYRGKGLPVDVGFKFKGKKIVFVIDVSGSMVREDRIGQVKAGLKMLITSMPADYELDVISFPGKSDLHDSLWGSFNPLETYRKTEVYKFLLNLKANGYTPTEAALSHALEHYEGASDIVLLSDGAPSDGNSAKPANISQIFLKVQQKNTTDVRINTIGVGSSFLENKSSKTYVFLENLAKDHGGFFVGF